jgi:tetratricopeptide (TPR) repeat protein
VNACLKYIFLTIAFLATCPAARAQGTKKDSLHRALSRSLHDTGRVQAYVALSEEYLYSPDSLLLFCRKAVLLANKNLPGAGSAEKKSYLLSKSNALNNMAFVYDRLGNYQQSVDNFQKSLAIRRELGDEKAIAESLNNLGAVFQSLGNIQTALEHYQQSLKIRNSIGDKKGAAASLNWIGGVYENQGNIPAALEYFGKSLKLREEISDKNGVAETLNNIGSIYESQGDVKNSADYYRKSLRLFEELGNKDGVSALYNNIGHILKKQGKIAEALDHFTRSLKINEETENPEGIAHSLQNIATCYKDLGDVPRAAEYLRKSYGFMKTAGDKYSAAMILTSMGGVYYMLAADKAGTKEKKKNLALALAYADSALVLAKQLGYPEVLKGAEYTLLKISQLQGNKKAAFEHYKKYVFYSDSLRSRESHKASVKNQLKYEFEKKEAVLKEQQEKERLVSEQKASRGRIAIWLIAAGLASLIAFAFFIFRSLRVTRHQKIIIEEKQKEVIDSIRYARRIQTSLLPPQKYIQKSLERLNGK